MKILILSLAFLALGESFTPPRAVKSSYTFHAHFVTGNEIQNTPSASTKDGIYKEVSIVFYNLEKLQMQNY